MEKRNIILEKMNIESFSDITVANFSSNLAILNDFEQGFITAMLHMIKSDNLPDILSRECKCSKGFKYDKTSLDCRVCKGAELLIEESIENILSTLGQLEEIFK